MSKNTKNILALIIIGYLLFIFGNGIVSLTNPDEVFYAGTAKEMAEQHSWTTPYLFGQPQFEKPIFTYWMIRIGFILFGVTNFAARFFPAVFAIIGGIAVYFLSLNLFRNEKKAYISSLVLMSGGLYIGLARTVFTDMIFSVFILAGLAAFYWGYTQHARKGAGIILSCIFMGLATLTKGPLGLFLPLFSIILFLFIKKDIKYLICRSSLWGALLFALISFPWYILMIKNYGRAFTYEFFYNDHIRRFIEAEHRSNDTWYFYPFSMIGCIFPWSIFLFTGLFYFFKNLFKKNQPYLFLGCWIAVVFLVFQPAHSKLISYIFPLFPALALIAGDFIYNSITLENKNRIFFGSALASWFILLLVPIGATAALNKYPEYVSDKLPVYIFGAIYVAWLIFLLILILRYKFLKSVYLISFFVPIFLVVVPFVINNIEPYVSSRDVSQLILKDHNVDNTILTSKFFARGVRFYTGHEIAVIEIPGSNYFSPHPIAFLDTDVKAREFLKGQKVSICVIKKSTLRDFERILAGTMKYTLIKKVGDEYLMKVEPLN